MTIFFSRLLISLCVPASLCAQPFLGMVATTSVSFCLHHRAVIAIDLRRERICRVPSEGLAIQARQMDSGSIGRILASGM